MKKKIIRINDSSQIDTKQISVYDLNNRYIDSQGNIYGLKYDRLNHKVEVVKLQRIHHTEVHEVRKQAAANKNQKKENIQESSLPEADLDDGEESLFFNPEAFIESAIKSSATHKERIKGIIMNLDESDAFPRSKKTEFGKIESLLKNLEIEGIQNLDKLEGYHKELTAFPRSLTYYQAKIGPEGKKMFDALAGKKKQSMKFVYFYEMGVTISAIYSNLRKHLIKLKAIMDDRDLANNPLPSKHMEQSFEDAQISVNNTIEDIKDILEQCKYLREYSKDINNF